MLKLTKEQVELGFANGFNVEVKGKTVGHKWIKADAPRWNWDDVDYRLSNTCKTGETFDELISAKENGKVVFMGAYVIQNVEEMVDIILQEPELMDKTFTIDRLVIAVDFDGTITKTGIIDGSVEEVKERMLSVEGEPQEYCQELINKWNSGGVIVIINTCRIGIWAEAAKKFLSGNDIRYDLFNTSTESDIENFGKSYKVSADIYIDDRNLGGLPEWRDIEYLVARHVYENIVKPSNK